MRIAEKIKVEKAEIAEQMRLEKIAESELRQAKLAEQLRVSEQKRIDDEADRRILQARVRRNAET